MKQEETKKQPGSNHEPATLHNPAENEEGIKDGEQGEDDLIDNMPDSHPAPEQTKKS
jgi:hypothetical protein